MGSARSCCTRQGSAASLPGWPQYLCRKQGGSDLGEQGGSDLGQLALRRLLSAPDHALGCPELRPATAISRLGSAGRPNPAFSTWPQHQACIAPPSPLSSPRPLAGRPPAGRPLAGRAPVAGRFSGTGCGSGAGCGIASSGVTIQSAAILAVRSRAQVWSFGGITPKTRTRSGLRNHCNSIMQLEMNRPSSNAHHETLTEAHAARGAREAVRRDKGQCPSADGREGRGSTPRPRRPRCPRRTWRCRPRR